MKIFIVLAGLLLWAAPLLAETYSWVDENGTYNYTEDYSRVPKKYRNKVDKRGDLGATPAPKESVSPSTGSSVTPSAASKNTVDGKPESHVGNTGAKSVYQWRQEFSEREAAMLVVRKRIDEIDALLNKSPSNREQIQSLIAERNGAVEQFTEMRKQYDQHAENARKAGIKFDILK